ncbi:MAG: amino acid ABC transporter ATP-binding protein, partial [Clostridium sp.]|nr:amino acid ABC transporter ATP-binding protein [Clostridium sp.]
MDDRRILLRTEHLHKEYDGTTVLKDVSLSVKKGEVIVIIGPSGCGKSTFLRCLNGLEPIQGGKITLDGDPVVSGAKEIARLRERIGMVFQSYELFPHKTI